jgi:hypothetical protein
MREIMENTLIADASQMEWWWGGWTAVLVSMASV